MYTVILSAHGNPDLGQAADRLLKGTRRRRVRVANFAEASKACMEYIRDHELGYHHWSGGQVHNDRGAKVAQISYNGKAWVEGKVAYTPE